MTAEEAEEAQGREKHADQPAWGPASASAEEELKFVSQEIRDRCQKMGVYPLGLPTQMQLVLEFRELASALGRSSTEKSKVATTITLDPRLDQSVLDGITARNRISTGSRVHSDHSLPGDCPVCFSDSLAISDRDLLLSMIRRLPGE